MKVFSTRILAMMLLSGAPQTSVSAQNMPEGWSEVPGIGGKKYEFPGSAMILALERPQKKLTLKKYFPILQKETATNSSCPILASAAVEPIFDGQALLAFSQEGIGRCFVLAGISNGILFTKVAVERNGGNTNVESFAKQLLATDMGYAYSPTPKEAIAGAAPVAPPKPKLALGVKTATTGFPTNYTVTSNCVTFQDIAQFKSVYLAGNMDTETRAMLINKITQIGSVQITPDAGTAEFLVEVLPDQAGSRLALWAVGSRPEGKMLGTRCNVMPNIKPTARQVVDELGQYLAIMGSSRRGPGRAVISPYRMSPTGFPDYINGPYRNKILCYKKISNEEILQFKNIYVAANTPPDLRNMITSAVNGIGRYNIVDDAVNANYLVTLDRDLQIETNTYKEPDRYVSHDKSPEMTAMGMPADNEEVFIPGKVTKKTTRFEISNLTIMGVKHPEKPGDIGVVCGIFSKQASKIRGVEGWAMKSPGKKMTAELIKFLNNPDLSYSDYPPEILEVLAKDRTQ
jgi:hypothetical protein